MSTTRMLVLLAGLWGLGVVFGSGAVAQEAKRQEETSVLKAPRLLEPNRDARPVQQASAVGRSSGDALVREAYGLTKKARTAEDYTQVIDLCVEGVRSGAGKTSQRYARDLMSWAFNRRGQLLAGAGQETAALADFEAAVENDPDRWRALHNRGVSYALLGRHEEAIADLSRTVELKPDHANAWFNRAELHAQLGRYAEAAADYSEAIKMEPEEAAFYNSRGHAWFRLGKHRDAGRDFTVALRLTPENPAPLANRGDLYAALGYYEKAVADYQGAIRLDPELGHTWLSAAWLMATCPDANIRSTSGALEAAEKALELGNVERHRALDVLAAAQANAGQYDQAQQTLRDAIRSAPREAADRYAARLKFYRGSRPFRIAPQQLPQLAGAASGANAVRQASASEPLPAPQQPPAAAAPPTKPSAQHRPAGPPAQMQPMPPGAGWQPAPFGARGQRAPGRTLRRSAPSPWRPR